MSTKGNNSSTTAADVAAQAADEKLIVPAQAEGKKTKGEDDNVVELNADGEKDAPKKTVKDRLTGLVENVKGRKEFLFGALVGGFVASVTVVKLAKAKAETVVEVVEYDEDPVTDEKSA